MNCGEVASNKSTAALANAAEYSLLREHVVYPGGPITQGPVIDFPRMREYAVIEPDIEMPGKPPPPLRYAWHNL